MEAGRSRSDSHRHRMAGRTCTAIRYPGRICTAVGIPSEADPGKPACRWYDLTSTTRHLYDSGRTRMSARGTTGDGQVIQVAGAVIRVDGRGAGPAVSRGSRASSGASQTARWFGQVWVRAGGRQAAVCDHAAASHPRRSGKPPSSKAVTGREGRPGGAEPAPPVNQKRSMAIVRVGKCAQRSDDSAGERFGVDDRDLLRLAVGQAVLARLTLGAAADGRAQRRLR